MSTPHDLIHALRRCPPDLNDPDEERALVSRYAEIHDHLLSLTGIRTVTQEQHLAYLRAYLAQLGVDDSHLPWEIAVSYNLRLAEALERPLP